MNLDHNLTAAIDEIRQHTDLKDFQLNHGHAICEKHKISLFILPHLVAVVAAERIKENAILTKKILPPEKEFIKKTVDMILKKEAQFNEAPFGLKLKHTPGDLIADFVLAVYAGHEKWWVKQYKKRIFNMVNHDKLMEAKIKETMAGWPEEPEVKRKKITTKTETK